MVGHDDVVAIRLVTWNLQGRERPDLAAVAAVLTALDVDVAVLQEVQRGQARRLASALGWSAAWRFKHWSIVVPPEGLAIVSRRSLVDVERLALAMPWSFWSWRRRIALAATLDGPERVRVVNLHLGAGVTDAERSRQARRSMDVVGDVPAVIAGDLNVTPGSVVLRVYEDAGFVDAWSSTAGDEPGFTNWRTGPRTAPPTQRLDYVYVDDALVPVDAWLPDDIDAVGRFGALSDHLPLAVTLGRDDPG